jgi:hypothetical protein
MHKDEFLSHEELTVAAAGYLPPFWLPLLLLTRWRQNYFTRYHLIHAALLSLSNLVLIVLTGLLSLLLSRFTGYSFLMTLLTGALIALSLLLSSVCIAYCALNAARGRYSVIPGLSQIYYALFATRPDSSPEALIRHHRQTRPDSRSHFQAPRRPQRKKP